MPIGDPGRASDGRPAVIVVAIDGPSGVGKSSVARTLARELEIPFLDTGAMYRCVGLEAVRAGIDPDDAVAVERLLGALDLELRFDPRKGVELLLNGEPVAEAIRSPEVAMVTSRIARQPAVRQRLVRIQRSFGERFGGVVEGRDIATVVFPGTPHRFFLDAAPTERARRRFVQLREAGATTSVDEVSAELAARDRQDTERSDSPLRCDDRYQHIDTTALDAEQVVAELRARIDFVVEHGRPASP